MNKKTTAMLNRWLRSGLVALFALAATAASVSAETLMMPKRDGLKGASLVVWGTTTLTGATYTIDFGDGVVTAPAAVTDQSYIYASHSYLVAGNHTATLSVTSGATTETATVAIQVFDSALLTPDALRSLNINMAIEDGLRWLWTAQSNRQGNFPNGIMTDWGGGWPESWTSLIVLAFENHGYQLPNSNAAATGVYEKYVVRRGLNYIMENLRTRSLGVQTAGDPCVGAGVEAAPCTGLFAARVTTDWWTGATNFDHTAYMTGVAILPIAASGALNRNVAEIGGGGSGGYVVGKTYGEILQRLANSMVWGQIDSCSGQGGWGYELIDGCNNSDGSTVGWGVLSLFDAGAAGAVVPAFAKAQVGIAMTNSINSDGSLDYQSDANAGSYNNTGIEKAGIGLQGLFFSGTTSPFAPGSTGDNITNYLSARWMSGRLGNDVNWGCQVGSQHNFGCAYSMFNNFKGLKLQGIATLPGSTRPAGPGAQPAGDWYAEYQDWLVTNQNTPNSVFGGQWSSMLFSCCAGDQVATAAIAELILSPVALVLPDEDKFGAFGLTPATNTAVEGGSHTVTAHAESTGGTPVPGATVNFTILTGPNAGLTGTDTTDSNGEATFTYTDGGPQGTVGTDTIRASIGALNSNVVSMTWTPLNQAPVATDNTYPATEDVQLVGNAVTDAVADSDADNDTLTATLVSDVSNGTLTFTNGAFTYLPNANYCGSDSFTYQVNDGIVDSNIATVTINVACVNDPPVAIDNTHSTLEDTPVSGTATSTDIDGGAATYAQSSPASNGSVVFNANGTYTYTPNANFNGTDSFEFTVSDGAGGSDVGLVTITIISVNDIPVCTAAAPSVSQIWPPNHKLVNVTIGGVTDVEGAITINVTSIFQDEPTNTQGDGNTSIDGYGVGSSTAQVRAERAGTPKLPGDGRMYHISFEGIDSNGDKCTGVVKVGVPHDQGKGSTVIDGGAIYPSTGQ